MGIRRGSITTGIIADGLVFNIDPANQSSYPKTGTVVSDTIGNTTSGSLTNDPTFSEDIAFNFDGTDDSIDITPNFIMPSDSFTTSLWYKNTSGGTPSGYRNLLGGLGNGTYAFTLNSGVWKTYTALSPTWEPMSDTNVTDGDWHNLTGVYNSNTHIWTSYVDGQAYNSIAASSGDSFGGQNFANTQYRNIGARSGATERFTLGSIGIVYAYNRILPANEVLHNYNALKNRFV
tara:strand:- start:872 stop:1570 length:699 start_codon:yes stop_codon:yes gene_type:complete